MADYDSPWKEAIEAYFEQFMLLFFHHIHADIDWSRGFEMLDKELQQIVQDAEWGHTPRGVFDQRPYTRHDTDSVSRAAESSKRSALNRKQRSAARRG